MALIRSAKRFDPSKGLKFLSYAGKAIRNAILDTIDAEARLSPDYEEVSIDNEAIEEKIAARRCKKDFLEKELLEEEQDDTQCEQNKN